MVFCTVVLVTGPIWGRPVWGIWWTWDARLTTTLILWLIYVSYLLVRKFAAGSEMQALASLCSQSLARSICRSIIWPTACGGRSIPHLVFGGDPDAGLKDPRMLAAFGWNVLAWAVWGLAVLAIRVYLEIRRQQAIDVRGSPSGLQLAGD